MFDFIYKYIKNISFLFFSLFNKLSKLIRIKYKVRNLKKMVINNLDSISLQLNSLKNEVNKMGVVYFCKINTGDEKKMIPAFNEIEINELGDVLSLIESDKIEKSLIKLGEYNIHLDNLIKNKDYLLSITPTVSELFSTGMNYYKYYGTARTKSGELHSTESNKNYDPSSESLEKRDRSSISLEQTEFYTDSGILREYYTKDEKFNLRTVVPSISNSTNERNGYETASYSATPYMENKVTTNVQVSIKGLDNKYVVCSNNLNEIAEILSIQGGQFWADSLGNYSHLVVPHGQDPSYLQYNTLYGGKAYTDNPIFVKFRTSNKNSIDIKIVLSNVEEVSTAYINDNMSYKTHSCLDELLVKVETISQFKPINKTPQNLDKDSPEIEYGDGGERYYEPWKFWFEGDLSNTSDGRRSWFKKWKSWFKNKVRIHNEWVNYNKDNKNPKPSEEDIDAWKEDNNYKQEHL